MSELDTINNLHDKNDRIMYILLKYWKDKPREYQKIYSRLYATYGESCTYEDLIARTISGINWVGDEAVHDEKTGDEIGTKNGKTWETNKIGINQIKTKEYPLSFQKDDKEKAQRRFTIKMCIFTFALSLLVNLIILFVQQANKEGKEKNIDKTTIQQE